MQDFLDARLVVLERNEVVRHVDECAECEQELLAMRDVYVGLNDMRNTYQPPRGFSNSIVSQLKADGVIRKPQRSPLAKAADRFLGLPAFARYPLAASLVVAALYLPVTAALGLAPEAMGNFSLIVANALLSLRDATIGGEAFADLSVRLTTAWNLMQALARAGVSTVESVVSNPRAVAGLAAFVVVGLGILVRLAGRRRSPNAPLVL